MARRPRPSPRLLLAAAAAALALVAAPVAAGAQEAPGAPAAPAALGPVLDGDVEGLTAAASTDFDGAEAMQVTVEVTNTTGAAATVAVPFGTLLATDEAADQTVAVGGPAGDPTLAAVAAAGGTPEVTAPPGQSSHTLVVYCTEADDGAPLEATPLRPVGPAEEPLPSVLRTVAAQDAPTALAQDAVWWVSDDASDPVPADLAPLLDGVDTAAFAAEPHRVVPDTGYTPRWARAGILDESFDGGTPAGGDVVGGAGPGLGLLVWLLAGAAVVVAAVVLGTRSGRPRPAPAPVATRGAGWYPDPWGTGGHRWWDGRGWTGRVHHGP